MHADDVHAHQPELVHAVKQDVQPGQQPCVRVQPHARNPQRRSRGQPRSGQKGHVGFTKRAFLDQVDGIEHIRNGLVREDLLEICPRHGVHALCHARVHGKRMEPPQGQQRRRQQQRQRRQPRLERARPSQGQISQVNKQRKHERAVLHQHQQPQRRQQRRLPEASASLLSAQRDQRDAGHRHHGHHVVHHQLVQAHAGAHGKPRRRQRRGQRAPWTLATQRRDGRHAAEQQRSLRHQHPPFADRLPRDHAAHIIDQAGRAGRIGGEGDQRVARSGESVAGEHRAHDQPPVRKIIIVGEHAAMQQKRRIGRQRHQQPQPRGIARPAPAA